MAKKRADYADITRYYACYYNNPYDPTSHRIDAESFQYYDNMCPENMEGSWYLEDRRLNIFAATGFAFSPDGILNPGICFQLNIDVNVTASVRAILAF